MKQWTLTLYELSELENNLYINIGLTFLSRVLADKGKLKKKRGGKTSSAILFSVNTVCKISVSISDLFVE